MARNEIGGARPLTFTSRLRERAEVVWSVVGTMEGVNAELAPWIRMTVPRSLKGLRIEDAPIGQVAFASWVLAAGIPFDRHAFRLERVTPPFGFLEHSTSFLQSSWLHERVIEPAAGGHCDLTDTLTITPRIALLAPIVERLVTRVFDHRHRQLERRFGGI